MVIARALPDSPVPPKTPNNNCYRQIFKLTYMCSPRSQASGRRDARASAARRGADLASSA
eukprot:46181-Heterocapsa_arctica.AAC.1